MSSRVTWLFACLLASCSFMGLDEYDLKPCEPTEPCKALNAQLPAGQCEEYVCDDSGFGCVMRPRDRDHDGHLHPVACADRDDLGPPDCDDENDERNAALDETCDGVDNDCDKWIDEGTKDDPGDPIRLVDELEHLSVSIADDDTLYAALTFDREPPNRNELWTFVGGDRSNTQLIGDVATCPIANDKNGSCNFGRIALAAVPHASFTAGLNYRGCGSGQLRISASEEPDLSALTRTSGLSFGVDIDAETSCTESTPCSGVAEPAVAALPALDSEPAQALVLWNAPREASTCPRWCAEDCKNDGAITVAALGVQPVASAAAEDRGSEPIGEGMGGSGPAVVAWPGAGAEGGYFVAFPGSEQLELRFVPRLSGPASSVREGLLQGRLAVPGASDVALALDASAGDVPRGLGVAFRVASGSAVAFAPLEFDRAADPALSARTPPIEFEAAEPITSGPVLAYARHGFFESEDARKTGGWLLMWIEGTSDGPKRLMAARIALTETHQLGRPIEVARGDDLRWPFAYVNQVIDGRDELAYGFVQDRDLHLGRFTCNPMQ